MKSNIRKKLAAGFGICVLLMVTLVAVNISALLRLEGLYRKTFHRGIDMELAADAQHVGKDIYTVIADAVINRDLAKSARVWEQAKSEDRSKLQRVALVADTAPERQQVDKAQRALEEIVGIYEREMLPKIQAGEKVPGPLTDIDSRIDARVTVIDRAMESVAHTISTDNARSSRAFHAVLGDTISLGLAFSFLGVIAALFISTFTTKRIVRPLGEITEAAHEVARGNYQADLPHEAEDETGVLAEAFRIMIAEVGRRTRDLEEANEHLNREVLERKRSEEEVTRLNAELEGRVAERTAELLHTNEQLESVITTQKKTEQQLQRSRAELRSLSRHLQEVRESERSRIARVIHDELGQMLTALKIDLSWMRKKLPEEQRQLLDKTVEISKHIDETIRTVQEISAELRPGILDDLGLSAAMEWQAQEFQQKTGITCQIRSGVDCSTLEKQCATGLFRIFQESLTNIYRHSSATRAAVTLREANETLTMTVTDNGGGISEEKLSDPKSLGLIGMRERVHSLGGKLTIGRLAGGGTRIRVALPYTRNKEVLSDDQDSRG